MAADKAAPGRRATTAISRYDDYERLERPARHARSVHKRVARRPRGAGHSRIRALLRDRVSGVPRLPPVRALSARGSIPDTLGKYATAIEAALVAFVVGGSFVIFQYCEMLWHFVGLTMALEVIALAAVRAREAEALDAADPEVLEDDAFDWDDVPADTGVSLPAWSD